MDAIMAQLDEDGNEEVSKEEFGPWFFTLDEKGTFSADGTRLAMTIFVVVTYSRKA